MSRFFLAAVVLLTLGSVSTLANSPPEPFERFVVEPKNAPPARIVGVFMPAQQPHGTLIFAHGYGQSKERFYGYDYLRRSMGWNLTMFDFREHGESSQSVLALSTLGHFEQWDLRAVIDWLDAEGAARPYVIYGRSMGAATALLEASADERISGVIASSPFKNAWLATQQITQGRQKWRLAADVVYGLTYKAALQGTDIPAAAARRDDLRIYVICGELDCFPEADARAILDASPAPASFKHLVVAPGKHHSNVWSWRGDGSIAGHDQLIERMLRDVEPATPYRIETAGPRKVTWVLVVFLLMTTLWIAVRVARARKMASPSIT